MCYLQLIRTMGVYTEVLKDTQKLTSEAVFDFFRKAQTDKQSLITVNVFYIIRLHVK